MHPQVETFRRLLSEKGFRVTPQRVSIYEFLVSTDRHPSAEEIYNSLKPRFPMMSPATVYKTLQLLVQLGLATEMALSDDANRYDGNPKAHINLVCVRCRRIQDADHHLLSEMAQWVAQESRFRVHGQRYELYGLCSHCQEAARGSDGQSLDASENGSVGALSGSPGSR